MADKALVLGINDYRDVSDLRGCCNDVENMRSLLTGTFGFPADRVRSFVDREVTKARVEPQMEWLFRDARPGDRLLFHFSGHGSYTADLDGDEPDRRDELICLHDMDFDRPSSYFLDDELRRWLEKLPEGAQLTVVMDNCHSGTGTRKIMPRGLRIAPEKVPLVQADQTAARALGGGTRGIGGASLGEVIDPTSAEAVLVRFVEPPIEIQEQVARLAGGGRSRSARPGLEAVGTMPYVLLAACRSDQTAADASIGGRFNGAFSYHLCQILRDAGPELDRSELARRLARALDADRFDQVPQLEARSLKGPLFVGGAAPGDGSTARPGRADDGGIGEGEVIELEPGALGDATGSGGGGDPAFVRRVEALREACDRVLEAAGAGGRAPSAIPPTVAARRRGAGRRYLVYVHGICRHDPRYSDPWWRSLEPYAAGLRPGRLGEQRREVLWSDVVGPGRRSLGAATAAEEEVRDRLVETMEDRARRQVLDASPVGDATGLDAPSGRGVEEAARGLGLPDRECLDDFVSYLTDPGVRDRVIDRFHRVVIPLLREGGELEIISHSWGTVVAYEGLRGLDASRFGGFVHNLFTVGSALSIGEVKRNLMPAARDGRRPRLVDRWVNLDARFDVVGGQLRGRPFEVDDEYLNLEPTGCVPAFIPNPVCSHGSYFHPENRKVNRDIFGAFIERAPLRVS